ncbi:MAG TPA: glycosyltransferase, partial [Opitutaceae bacterium]
MKASTLFQRATMTKARITVIVSLFNYQHIVTDTLESIKAQSLPHLTLIVVDDASTDNSATDARRRMDRNHTSFSRCVLLTHHRNRGPSAARN